MTDLERSDLAWWYPRLVRTGIRTPSSVVLAARPEESPRDTTRRLCRLAADEGMRLPLFLRSGLAAHKHAWTETCWVTRAAMLPDQLERLRAWHQERDLPLRSWALRRPIPLVTYATAFAGTPIAREFRVFVRGETVLRCHPLWTADALERGDPGPGDWMLRHVSASEIGADERRVILNLSAHLGGIFTAWGEPDDWAMDWAADASGGWWLIDLAAAALSWSPPGVRDHVIAPAEYAIGNATQDKAALWQLRRSLTEEFAQELENQGVTHGYG